MSLVDGFLKEVPDNAWAALSVGKESRLWIPVVRFGEAGFAIGILDNGEFAWGELSGQTRGFLLTSPFTSGLLIILELSLSELVTQVEQSERVLNLPGLKKHFPFGELVRIALKTRSDYWIGLALPIFDIPIAAPNELLHEMETASLDAKLSQSCRHSLVRIINRQKADRVSSQSKWERGI